jgi:hypothetical protein
VKWRYSQHLYHSLGELWLKKGHAEKALCRRSSDPTAYDATVAAWNAKYTYNRPRPSELDPSLTTMVPNPRSPSYPSEHVAVAAAAVSSWSVWRHKVLLKFLLARARMPLGILREQDMIIRERLGQPAGDRDDFQRGGGRNAVTQGGDHCRAQLPDAIDVPRSLSRQSVFPPF